MKRSTLQCWCCLLLLSTLPAKAQVTLSAHVELGDKRSAQRSGSVVLWLSPVVGRADFLPSASPRPRLVQHNKSFEPHVLVVPVGAVVEFPNRDPFFHNVFSLFEGKSFDLGLYEAGSTREVHFDKAGISYIFCNIHAEMSAVVIALDTPYYGISNARGEVIVSNVPPGRYNMHVWYEASLPDKLKELTREISVSENSSTLGVIHLPQSELQAHKNKYGREYDQPVPADSPGYQRP